MRQMAQSAESMGNAERDLFCPYPLRLQFFAQEGPGGEKTEEPTTKKLEDARKEGQVSKSQELTTAFGLMGLFLSLKVFTGFLGNLLL